MKKEYYDELKKLEDAKARMEEKLKRLEDAKAEIEENRMMHAYAPPPPPPACYSQPMGLAPGGSMRQKIYEDTREFDAWDLRKSERCFVTIANANQWMGITGEEPPISSYTAHEYTKAGLPWFDHYDGDKVAIDGAKRLKKIKSIKNIKSKTRKKIWKEDYDLPITDPTVVPTNRRVVNAGEW